MDGSVRDEIRDWSLDGKRCLVRSQVSPPRTSRARVTARKVRSRVRPAWGVGLGEGTASLDAI